MLAVLVTVFGVCAVVALMPRRSSVHREYARITIIGTCEPDETRAKSRSRGIRVGDKT